MNPIQFILLLKDKFLKHLNYNFNVYDMITIAWLVSSSGWVLWIVSLLKPQSVWIFANDVLKLLLYSTSSYSSRFWVVKKQHCLVESYMLFFVVLCLTNLCFISTPFSWRMVCCQYVISSLMEIPDLYFVHQWSFLFL